MPTAAIAMAATASPASALLSETPDAVIPKTVIPKAVEPHAEGHESPAAGGAARGGRAGSESGGDENSANSPASSGPSSYTARRSDRSASPEARPERDELILKHLALVRAIANRVRENLPVQVELDDLLHAGILGLFDAVDKYDPGKKVVFHLYAKHRIRGAILDSLRQLDWASRDLRKRHKLIETTTQRLAQNLGRLPTEVEVAQSLGVSEERFRKQAQELYTAGLTAGQPHRVEKPDHSSFAETSQSPEQRPDELFSNHQLRGVLDSAIQTLPPRYQRVIKLYYDQDRTMKQIGSELGVNESRVSQIHKAALEKLGTALREGGYESATVFLGAERRV